MNFDWRDELASTLQWWRDAGVDTLVDDAPRDWLARLPKPNPAAAVEAAPAALPATLEAFTAWRMSAAAPETAWRTPRIAPIGDAGAPLMVLLDMPEPEDSQTGMLMSGPEGRLLDRMLAAIGHSRATVYLATVAVARPLSSIVPSEFEPRLAELTRHLLGLVAPGQLLFMGNLARRVLAEAPGGYPLGSLQEINHDGGKVFAIATLTPRALLEQPARKGDAWKHLQMLGGNGR